MLFPEVTSFRLKCLAVWVVALSASGLLAAPPVSFDAPAIVPAVPIDSDLAMPPAPDSELLEIIFPVSTLVQTRQPLPPYQLWFFCQAPGVSWRVVDFAPQTELTTPYTGPLQTDTQKETSHRLGLHLAGPFEPWGNGQATSELAGKEKRTTRVAEAPPMMLLQASGTIDRGTGVYYKFRPSRQTTLEGMRQLRIVVEVPRSWQTSLVRLHCLAEPIEEGVAPFGEAIFAIAVYRAGSSDALARAESFTKAEREFRRAWRKAERSLYDHSDTFLPSWDWLPDWIVPVRSPDERLTWVDAIDRIVFHRPVLSDSDTDHRALPASYLLSERPRTWPTWTRRGAISQDDRKRLLEAATRLRQAARRLDEANWTAEKAAAAANSEQTQVRYSSDVGITSKS